MKHICVYLTACLAIMVLTQAKPLPKVNNTNKPCQMPTVCGRRSDGMCHVFINKCMFDNENCRVNYASNQVWTMVDMRHCRTLATSTSGPCVG